VIVEDNSGDYVPKAAFGVGKLRSNGLVHWVKEKYDRQQRIYAAAETGNVKA